MNLEEEGVKSVGISFSRSGNRIVDLTNGEEKEVGKSQLHCGGQRNHPVIQVKGTKAFFSLWRLRPSSAKGTEK